MSQPAVKVDFYAAFNAVHALEDKLVDASMDHFCNRPVDWEELRTAWMQLNAELRVLFPPSP
jgi:hypothetical protein